MHFRNHGLSKTWFHHSLKSAVSEHPSTFNTLKGPNIVKGPKQLLNLYQSTFIMFFHHYVRK